jgi:hypothetical protein
MLNVTGVSACWLVVLEASVELMCTVNFIAGNH